MSENKQDPFTQEQKHQQTRLDIWAPTRPMPAQAYYSGRLPTRTSSQQEIPLPENQLLPPPQGKRPGPRRRRRGIGTILTLILLLVLTAAGGLVGQYLLSGEQIQGHRQAIRQQKNAPDQGKVLNMQQANALLNHMQYRQLASLYVSQMTLDELLGQLIMVEYAEPTYSDELDLMIDQLHVGGVILYEFQIQTIEQTRQDIARMQQRAALPLLISTDEEGGLVHRLTNVYPPRPSALAIYESSDPNYAALQGRKVAQDLLSLGINVNLAPSVDVALIPDAPNQFTRTFGYTVDSVIKFAGPYIKAMQGEGVTACIKHFPGLGASETDAHFTLPVVQRSKEEIYQVELAPFKHFIQSADPLENPGLVMPTDVLIPAIDPIYPAELSPTFITGILRKELGYDGVVLTDALYMKGVQVDGKLLSMPQAGVLALKAGVDMLLGPTGVEQTRDMLKALKEAIQDGTLSEERVKESATRIIILKIQKKLLSFMPSIEATDKQV